jgi:hypothetical protein
MDNNGKLEGADSFVPYDHLTSKTRLLDTISLLVDDTEESETPRATGTTSADQGANTGWAQRVLSWFRGA